MLSNFSTFGSQGFAPQGFGPQGFGPQGFGPQGWGTPFPVSGYEAFQGQSQPSFSAHSPAQQIIPVLGQIAQQLAIQSAMTQQLGAALHQLAQQVAIQVAQPQQGFGQQQGLGQFGFPHGWSPQNQPWGANRAAQTVQ